MSIFSNHFPLGLGTSRFPIAGPDDTKGIEQSIALVYQALESGITYVDVGYNYSAGMALFVLKEAFQQTTQPFSVTQAYRIIFESNGAGKSPVFYMLDNLEL